MVGDEASKLRSMLEVSYPMENGVSLFVVYLAVVCMLWYTHAHIGRFDMSATTASLETVVKQCTDGVVVDECCLFKASMG